MFTQARILEGAIVDSGWRILHKLEMPEWWADEMWHIESAWSPVGISAWIVFLVDPQLDHSSRRKGEHVWAVAASIEKPTSRIDANFICKMSINSGWQENLNDLIDTLNTTRHVS